MQQPRTSIQYARHPTPAEKPTPAGPVSDLFHQFRIAYRDGWQPGDDDMAAWRRALAPYGRAVIRQAWAGARETFVERPPTPVEMAAICAYVANREHRLRDHQAMGVTLAPVPAAGNAAAERAMVTAWRRVAYRGGRYVGMECDESREYLVMMQMRLLRAAGESLPAALKRVMKGR